MPKLSSIALLPEDMISTIIDKLDTKKIHQADMVDWANKELEIRWQPILTQLSQKEQQEVSEKLNDLEIKPQAIAEWINKKLKEKGLEETDLKILRISKSALSRYWINVEKNRHRLDIAREAASRIIGGADGNNDLGVAITELIKEAAFEVIQNKPENMNLNELMKFLGSLSNIIKRVSEASKHDSDRIRQENEIRKQEREEAIKDLKETINQAGLSDELSKELLKGIGVEDAA